MRNLMIVGGGFAGVWAAMGAARALADAGQDNPATINVTLINPAPYLVIRPRLYEAKLEHLRVPLDSILGALSVQRLEGSVTDIDGEQQTLTVSTQEGMHQLAYDRLVLAAGSRLSYPDLPGLRRYSFSVDTYEEALRLQQHLEALPSGAPRDGQFTAVVIGAGFTGIEVATELITRLADIAGTTKTARVVLLEQAPRIAPDMNTEQQAIIEEALSALGIEFETGVRVADVDPAGVTLADGRSIPAATTIWSGGLRASPLTERLAASRDRLGRLEVDRYLRVPALPTIFAAGDVASALADPHHRTYMSCQHAIPLGKYAGYNAARDLLGKELIPFEQRQYVTCLDLGAWGALFTQGWERTVTATGARAKAIKRHITQQLIYPPIAGGRQTLLDAVDFSRQVRF